MARNSEKKPKSYQQTTLSWKWNFHDAESKSCGGHRTNLPANEHVRQNDVILAPRLQSVTVVSNSEGDGGEIRLEFDYPVMAGGHSALEEGIAGLCKAAYEARLIDSKDGPEYRSHGVFLPFILGRREGSFCDCVIQRVVALLDMLGISKEKVGRPRITQETYVFAKVPPHQAEAWVPFGEFLGEKHGLSF